ncbi:MAG TPA: biotin/lipoyl-containing protein [Acidimicrobiales bacterium]|nr:biotin/lipoyl-containing protein [Acidimicrobiales bacterium]
MRHSTTWLTERVDLSAVPVGGRGLAEEVPAGAHPEDIEVEVDGRRFEVKVWLPSRGVRPVRPAVAPAGGRSGAGAPRAGAPAPAPTAGGGGGQVTVPMQGTVVKVLVNTGDEVEAGQTVCVLEAMKMENNIVSQWTGRVSEVRVDAGDPVGTGDVIIVVGPGGG